MSIEQVVHEMVIGVLGSLVASVVFVVLTYRLKPRLTLSSQIARTEFEGAVVYAMKIVNSGRRNAIEIKCELLMIEPQVVNGGLGKNILQIPLVRAEWFQLAPGALGDKPGVSMEFISTADIEGTWAMRGACQ